MREQQLNDELTIVGLILVLLFLMYYLFGYAYKAHKLHTNFIEAQRVVIILNNELTETKDELHTLKKQKKDSVLISRILKDLASSWNSRTKD